MSRVKCRGRYKSGTLTKYVDPGACLGKIKVTSCRVKFFGRHDFAK